MNVFNGLGRLCYDIELKDGRKDCYCFNCVAIDNPYDKDSTDFVKIAVFGKAAERMEQYCKKGSRIAVTGRLQIDNSDGEYRGQATIMVDHFDIIDWNDDDNTRGSSRGNDRCSSRGNDRGSSRGNDRGSSRGNDQRGSSRGNDRGGSSRGNDRSSSRGNARDTGRGNSRESEPVRQDDEYDPFTDE